MNKNIQLLEKRIGYSFKDLSLLKTALTHTSYANEHRRDKIVHNERLEFLGDAVLEAVSSEFLYRRYPERGEGELSTLRASMVCEPSLAICARQMGLPEYLYLGKGEERTGGRHRDSITSDAVEAMIGAIYLDGGFESAKGFILNNILTELRDDELYVDFKSRLQELVQDRGQKVIYTLTGADGPDHDKHFSFDVHVGGRIVGHGEGHTKKLASQNAAEDAIRNLEAEAEAGQQDD